MNTMPLRILAVCTGNICRSPMTEMLLRSAFDEAHPQEDFSVTSAGTQALAGYGMDDRMAAQLTKSGLRRDPFVARQVTREMLENSDLVLALAREHRREVLKISPGLVRKTYTLRELAGLFQAARGYPDSSPGRSWRDVTTWAPLFRSVNSIAHAELDVVDPYGGSEADYRRAAEQITSAVGILIRGSSTVSGTDRGE